MADGKESLFSQHPQCNTHPDTTPLDETNSQNMMTIPPFLQHQFQEMRGSFGFKNDSEFLLYLMRKSQHESRIPPISSQAPDQILPVPSCQPLSYAPTVDPTHQVDLRDQNGQQISSTQNTSSMEIPNKHGPAAGYLPQYSFIAKETQDNHGSESGQFKSNGIDLLARAAADIGVMKLDPTTGSFIAQPEAPSAGTISPYSVLPTTGTICTSPEEGSLQQQPVINQVHQAGNTGVLCESAQGNGIEISETFSATGGATLRGKCKEKTLYSEPTNQTLDNTKHCKSEHKCFLCHKIFKTKQDQIKHVSNHTGIYKCQFCEKVFTKYCVFIFHQKTHNRKDHSCSKCSFKTFHSYALKRHLLASHVKDRIDNVSTEKKLRSSKNQNQIKAKEDMKKFQGNDKVRRLRNKITQENVKAENFEISTENKIEEDLLENFLPAMMDGMSKLKKEIAQPKHRGRQAKKTKDKKDSSILLKSLEKQLADLVKRIKKKAPKRTNVVQKRSPRKKKDAIKNEGKTSEQKHILQTIKACREILGLHAERKTDGEKSWNKKSDKQLEMLKRLLQTKNNESSDNQDKNGTTVELDSNTNQDTLEGDWETQSVKGEKTFKKEIDYLPNKTTTVKEKSKPAKKVANKNKKLSCALCEEEFLDRISLTQHAEGHKTPENLYACMTCDATSKSYYEIASHQIIHQTDKQVHACTHCIQAFPQRYLLNRHIKKKHSFLLNDDAEFDPLKGSMKCPQCDVYFTHDHKLEEHIGAVHNDGTQAPRYICEICGASYHIKGSYRTHMRRHVGDDMKCPHCSYTSKYSGTLKEHIRLVHLNEHKYVCEECGRSFKRKRNIDEHRWSVHLHCKKFVCSYEGCGKTFGARRHLVVHQRIHTGEKPLKCQYCDFTCRQKNSINWHMKQHVNITGPVFKPVGKGRPKIKKDEIQGKNYNKKLKDKKAPKNPQQNIQANLVQMPETMPTLSLQTSTSTSGNLSQLVSALHQQEPLDFASNSMSFTDMAPAYTHTRQPISSFLHVIEPKGSNAGSASNFLVVAQAHQEAPQTQMQAMPLGCVPLPHSQGIPSHPVVVSQQSNDTMATDAITSQTQPSSSVSQEGANAPSYYSQEMMIAATTLAGQFYE